MGSDCPHPAAGISDPPTLAECSSYFLLFMDWDPELSRRVAVTRAPVLIGKVSEFLAEASFLEETPLPLPCPLCVALFQQGGTEAALTLCVCTAVQVHETRESVSVLYITPGSEWKQGK